MDFFHDTSLVVPFSAYYFKNKAFKDFYLKWLFYYKELHFKGNWHRHRGLSMIAGGGGGGEVWHCVIPPLTIDNFRGYAHVKGWYVYVIKKSNWLLTRDVRVLFFFLSFSLFTKPHFQTFNALQSTSFQLFQITSDFFFLQTLSHPWLTHWRLVPEYVYGKCVL